MYRVFKDIPEETTRSSVKPEVCGKDKNTMRDSPPLSLVQSAVNLKKVKKHGFQLIFKKSNENW